METDKEKFRNTDPALKPPPWEEVFSAYCRDLLGAAASDPANWPASFIAERREESIAQLTQLVVRTYLHDRYFRLLAAEEGNHRETFAAMREKRGDFPIEAVVENGLSALSNEQLARFALDRIEISGLSEFIGESLGLGQCGNVWHDAILAGQTIF